MANAENQLISRNNWFIFSEYSGDVSDINKMHENTGFIKIIFKLNKNELYKFFMLFNKKKICESFLFDDTVEGFCHSLNYKIY